eukprot:769703-Rhodomonas_salina.1
MGWTTTSRGGTWTSLHIRGVAGGHSTWSAGPRMGQKMTNGSPNVTSPTLKRCLTRILLDRRRNPPQRHGPNVVNWLFAAYDALATSGTMRDHSSI